MSKDIARRAPARNETNDLPLFSWQPPVVQRPLSRAGLHVMRRYCVHPDFADLVANFAGFGGSEER
jgi:hypothetical protein